MSKEVRKLIDLPQATVNKLQAKAKKERQRLKPYMELVLINHSDKQSKTK